jgi:hypothetical protein
VSWKTPMPVAEWSDSVWVFIDYNNAGRMTRLPLLPGAEIITTSAPGVGRMVEVPGNTRGVWLVGNARSAGSFSAKIKLLTPLAKAAGACAYASNYRPAAKYTSPTSLAFKGVPAYIINLRHADGSASTTVSGGTYVIPASYTLESFTDATGAPGLLRCKPAEGTLEVSATGFCEGSEGVVFAMKGTEAGAPYQLYKNGVATGTVLTGTGSAATFSGKFNAEGTYTARVNEGEYCGAAMNGTHIVTANPLPKAPNIVQPANICQNGGDIVFIAVSYSGTLTWTSNGGGAVNGRRVTFPGCVTGTKTVEARSEQPYQGAPTCYSSTVTRSATVYAPPVITDQPKPQTFCEPKVTVTLTVAATPGSSGELSYQWKGGTGAGSNVGTDSPTQTYSVSKMTDYWVVVTDGNRCTAVSDKATIIVSGYAAGEIGTAKVCAGGPGRIGLNK